MVVEGPDGDERYIHSELSFGGEGQLMVGGEWSEWAKSPRGVSGNNTQMVRVRLHKPTEDGDAEAAIHKALQIGARAIRYAQVKVDTMVVESAFDGMSHVKAEFMTPERVNALEPEGAPSLAFTLDVTPDDRASVLDAYRKM